MNYQEKAKDLYDMIFAGKLLDAFDKYYHEDVVMQEMGSEPRVGKAINRVYEEKFLSSLKEFHGAGLGVVTVDEENAKVMIENWMDVTFQDGNRVKIEQVCVQEWKGEQIVAERFYHN